MWLRKVDTKFEQQTKTNIKPIIFVALLDNEITVLKSKLNIMIGSANIITDLMLRLIEYNTCCTTIGTLKNIIANISAANINGILRDMRNSLNYKV